MPDLLNTPICKTSTGGNTGIPTCAFDIKKIVMVILADPSHRITAANRASISTLKGVLQTATLASGTSRIYPIPHVVLQSDNSEDITITTDAYGTKEVARDGDYDWTFLTKKGYACYNASLRKFNYRNMGAYFVDSDMNIFGTMDGTDMRPATLSFFHAMKWKVADGSNATQYMFRLSLSNPEEVNDAGKLAFVACGGDQTTTINFISELNGVIDVTVEQSSVAAGTIDVLAKTSCGKTNLYDDYSTELAAAGAWIVKNASTGAVLTPSGVAANATTEGFTISVTLTGAATVQLQTPAALAALSVGSSTDGGYESNILTTDALPAP